MNHSSKSRNIILSKLVLFLIILLASILRIYKLDSIPPGLHRDEASTGYNAYSVLRTGYDEHRQFFPLVFKAFGDWKRPINVYLTMLFIPFTGLTELAVRLPIALIGSLSVLLIYLLAKRITSHSTIGLLAAFFLAISPWHIFMSRTGLGWDTVGLFFFLLGVYLLLTAQHRVFVLSAAAVCMGLTLFSYASNQIMTPVFLFICTVLFFKRISANIRVWLIPACIFAVFFVTFIWVYYPVFRTNSVGSSFYTEEFIYTKNNLSRLDHGPYSIFRLLHNKYGAVMNQFAENYLSIFSTQFLFFNDQDNPSYSMVNLGNFYILDVIFIALGLFLFVSNEKKYRILLVILLLITPIPAAVTKNPYSSTRSLLLVPLFSFTGAYAIFFLFHLLKGKGKYVGRIFVYAVVVLCIVNSALFMDEYFIHFPVNRAKHWGIAQKELVQYLVKQESQFNEIIIGRPEDALYSQLVFYKMYDPIKFQQEITWYPTTSDGFTYAKSLGKYSFRPIEYEKDSLIAGRLLVDVLDEGNKERQLPLLVTPYLKKVTTIRLPNGSPVYIVYETQKIYTQQ